jgi:hypothetical protein
MVARPVKRPRCRSVLSYGSSDTARWHSRENPSRHWRDALRDALQGMEWRPSRGEMARHAHISAIAEFRHQCATVRAPSIDCDQRTSRNGLDGLVASDQSRKQLGNEREVTTLTCAFNAKSVQAVIRLFVMSETSVLLDVAMNFSP